MRFPNHKTDIRFTSARGEIEISAKLARMLGLEAGDIIGLHSSDEELYIYKLAPKAQNLSARGRCMSTGRGNRFLRVQWAEASRAIIAADATAKAEARYRVGQPIQSPDGKTMVPIITRINYAAERN